MVSGDGAVWPSQLQRDDPHKRRHFVHFGCDSPDPFVCCHNMADFRSFAGGYVDKYFPKNETGIEICCRFISYVLLDMMFQKMWKIRIINTIFIALVNNHL